MGRSGTRYAQSGSQNGFSPAGNFLQNLPACRGDASRDSGRFQLPWRRRICHSGPKSSLRHVFRSRRAFRSPSRGIKRVRSRSPLVPADGWSCSQASDERFCQHGSSGRQPPWCCRQSVSIDWGEDSCFRSHIDHGKLGPDTTAVSSFLVSVGQCRRHTGERSVTVAQPICQTNRHNEPWPNRIGVGVSRRQ